MQGNCLLLAVATIGVHSFLSVNCCYSVTKLCLCEMLFLSRDSLRLRGLQHARLLCPSLSPRLCSNSYPLSRWCYLTISSSATCFSFGLQSFPASGSSPMSQSFTSGGQSTRASASASVLPMNIQGWFPLGLLSLISLLAKRLSKVFSSTQFESISSLAFSLLYGLTLTFIRDHSFDYTELCQQSDVFSL